MAEPTFDQFRDSLQAVELSAIEPQVADVVREVRGRGSQSKIDFYDRMTELLGSWYGVGPWIGAWYSLYCNELEGKHDENVAIAAVWQAVKANYDWHIDLLELIEGFQGKRPDVPEVLAALIRHLVDVDYDDAWFAGIEPLIDLLLEGAGLEMLTTQAGEVLGNLAEATFQSWLYPKDEDVVRYIDGAKWVLWEAAFDERYT